MRPNDQSQQPNLLKRWAIFVNVLLQPDILLLILLTVGLHYVSTIPSQPPAPQNQIVNTTFTVLIALLSGITGGLISVRLEQLTEESLLAARGKSAIRSLKLLLQDISSIEKRLSTHKQHINRNTPEFNRIINSYDEIIDRCLRLQEHALNSIENWTDIVPEANVVSQIGVITSLTESIKKSEAELQDLRTQIQNNAAEAKSKDELEQQLREKEEEVKKTKSRLVELETLLDSSILSGISIIPKPTSGLFKTIRITPSTSSNSETGKYNIVDNPE
jgi:hypothetical protein